MNYLSFVCCDNWLNKQKGFFPGTFLLLHLGVEACGGLRYPIMIPTPMELEPAIKKVSESEWESGLLKKIFRNRSCKKRIFGVGVGFWNQKTLPRRSLLTIFSMLWQISCYKDTYAASLFKRSPCTSRHISYIMNLMLGYSIFCPSLRH